MFLHQRLQALRESGGELASALYFCEIAYAGRAFTERSRKYIGRRDGVLNGEIDPHPAHRGHGVRRIADTHETGAIPRPQAIDPDGQ